MFQLSGFYCLRAFNTGAAAIIMKDSPHSSAICTNFASNKLVPAPRFQRSRVVTCDSFYSMCESRPDRSRGGRGKGTPQ